MSISNFFSSFRIPLQHSSHAWFNLNNPEPSDASRRQHRRWRSYDLCGACVLFCPAAVVLGASVSGSVFSVHCFEYWRASEMGEQCVFPSSRNLYDVLVGPSIGRRRHPITGAISCQTERNRTPIKHDIPEWTAYGPRGGGGAGNWCAFALSVHKGFLKCKKGSGKAGCKLFVNWIAEVWKRDFMRNRTLQLSIENKKNVGEMQNHECIIEELHWHPLKFLLCFRVLLCPGKKCIVSGYYYQSALLACKKGPGRSLHTRCGRKELTPAPWQQRVQQKWPKASARYELWQGWKWER